jgi:16S rRNA (uracil1498-N3)-methyltransferase
MGRGSYVSGAVRRGEEWQVPAVTPELVLAVAPPRSIDRLRFIVEKAAELDVAAVQWLRTGRSEGRVPRYEKLAAWAIGALEQSSGAWRMNVAATQSSIDDVVVADRQQSLLLVADAAGMPIAEMRTAVDGAPRIVVAIGPEGGFVADEVPAGATRVALGDRILRVETAAVAAAAVLRLG